jgi:hypothetical protein
MGRSKYSLKQGDVLLPLFFALALKHVIRSVQENQEGLNSDGTHQHLACADDIVIVGENIHTQKNTEDASKGS